MLKSCFKGGVLFGMSNAKLKKESEVSYGKAKL